MQHWIIHVTNEPITNWFYNISPLGNVLFVLGDDRLQQFSRLLDETSSFVGWTALHYAAKRNYIDIIELLYKYGKCSCPFLVTYSSILELPSHCLSSRILKGYLHTVAF